MELDRPEPYEPGYETYYETEARPRIVRRLRRLCNEFGWDVVLNVFANDMPEHRRERELEERAKQRERKKKSVACAGAGRGPC